METYGKSGGYDEQLVAWSDNRYMIPRLIERMCELGKPVKSLVKALEDYKCTEWGDTIVLKCAPAVNAFCAEWCAPEVPKPPIKYVNNVILSTVAVDLAKDWRFVCTNMGFPGISVFTIAPPFHKPNCPSGLNTIIENSIKAGTLPKMSADERRTFSHEATYALNWLVVLIKARVESDRLTSVLRGRGYISIAEQLEVNP